MKAIRLALVDDHPIIRRSFEIVCESIEGISIVGNFGTSKELLNWLEHASCDVLILDYILQRNDRDGLSLIKMLLINYPDVKILLSSSMNSLSIIRTAYMLGVMGYISKRESSSEYIKAIRTLAQGQRYIPENVAIQLAQLPGSHRAYKKIDPDMNSGLLLLSHLLTSREALILRYYLDGMRIKDIADKLERSSKTISGHKQAAMKKLGISNDLELFKCRDSIYNKSL